MRNCPTCPRSRLFVVHRQRGPASPVSCSPPKSLSRPQRPRSCLRRHSLWFQHVVSPPEAVQRARGQCASRSFNKVFVGRRLAPLPASGKYRCPSSARFARSSATLADMAMPNHLRSSKSCGAKYGAGSRAAALPNPSVKASANGRPGYSQLLFLLPPGLPLAPPYLER